MHIKNKWENTLRKISKLEGEYTEKVKKGSTEPLDFHYMSYYSGVHNGFNLYWMLHEATEREFDEQVERILQRSNKVDA